MSARQKCPGRRQNIPFFMLTRLISAGSQQRPISLLRGRVFSLSILWRVWWRARLGTSLTAQPAHLCPLSRVWSDTPAATSEQSHSIPLIHHLRHSDADTFIWGEFILIQKMLLLGWLNKSGVNTTVTPFCGVYYTHAWIRACPEERFVFKGAQCGLPGMIAKLTALIKLKDLFFCQRGDMSKSDDC